MILFPAIDLYGGRVVRLKGGDFGKMSFYATTPLEAAKRFQDAGCEHIHIVDLEGAKTGAPKHLEQLEAIAGLGMFTQYGGGLRSAEAVKAAVNAGADRVMIGSLLFKSPAMPDMLIKEFGAAAMPAIDVKGGRVVCSGWLEATDFTPAEALKNLSAKGFKTFLVTDTERDGMMAGARTELYKNLVGTDYDIVAAGGITTTADLKALAGAGVAAAVVGKSLYEGGVTIEDALAAAQGGK